MPFQYGQAAPGQIVLIHGAAGNVGAYAVQMARNAGLEIFGTAAADDLDHVRGLGAQTAIDYQDTLFEDVVPAVDIVVDLVGGETRARSVGVLKRGGVLVSVVSDPMPEELAHQAGVRAVFLSELFDSKQLLSEVGTVLPLEDARLAHEMLAGAPHARGKIVLKIAAE